MVKLILNGNEIQVPDGTNMLKACHDAGTYVPSLCYHPDLGPFSGCTPSATVYRSEEIIEDQPGSAPAPSCGLCMVDIAGRDTPVRACETTVTDGIRVVTDTEKLRELRRDKLSGVLSGHPRVCLVCPHNEGCDRINCSMNAPENQRCCAKFNHCELRKVVQYVGINRNIPQYVPTEVPKIKGGKLFEYDLGLCIGCLRCVRACAHEQGTAVIGYVRNGDGAMVGTLKETLAKSGCKFCGACVAVCPTGAMMAASDKCGQNLNLSSVMLPPLALLAYTQEEIDKVPEEEGVVQLFDENSEVIYIAGAVNMRKELQVNLESSQGAKYFIFDNDEMFTQRQNELIQHYIDTHGQQPRINEELDDLF
jgi:predicted molibdopterin-dependent oxidoreductase YjgC